MGGCVPQEGGWGGGGEFASDDVANVVTIG
jgi:hypothetical protein